jgi:type IV pilus assembly protein PilV
MTSGQQTLAPQAIGAHRSRAAAGFSLVEVMVAVIVLSVGLLGIARMQSLAISSTSVSSKRSIAAIQAASLAAVMHENRAYWTKSDPAGALITIKAASVGPAITIDGNGYAWTGAATLAAASAADCTSTCVTPAQVAAYDLKQWATAANSVLPNATTLIKCGTLTPVSCMVTISWTENVVAVNAQAAAAAAAATAKIQIPTYTVYIEP